MREKMKQVERELSALRETVLRGGGGGASSFYNNYMERSPSQMRSSRRPSRLAAPAISREQSQPAPPLPLPLLASGSSVSGRPTSPTAATSTSRVANSSLHSGFTMTDMATGGINEGQSTPPPQPLTSRRVPRPPNSQLARDKSEASSSATSAVSERHAAAERAGAGARARARAGGGYGSSRSSSSRKVAARSPDGRQLHALASSTRQQEPPERTTAKSSSSTSAAATAPGAGARIVQLNQNSRKNATLLRAVRHSFSCSFLCGGRPIIRLELFMWFHTFNSINSASNDRVRRAARRDRCRTNRRCSRCFRRPMRSAAAAAAV